MRAIDPCHRIDGFVEAGCTQPQLSNLWHSSSFRVRVRKSDGAADCGWRESFDPCSMTAMSSSLGFWSVDPAAGVLTCCPTATAILGISGSHSGMLRDVLSRLHAPDRRRVLRAGLTSLTRRSTFDILVLMRTPDEVRLLRVIGGAGYDVGQRDAPIHGVIEQIGGQGTRNFPTRPF